MKNLEPLLLGWGEQTFSRYCDGDLPTKQYSEILKKIYDDQHYYSTRTSEGTLLYPGILLCFI